MSSCKIARIFSENPFLRTYQEGSALHSKTHELLTSVASRMLHANGSLIRLRQLNFKTTTQWTHPRRFAIDSTSKFHVESSSKLHRFWKANPRGNYDIDSTWIRLSKSTKYRWVFHVDFSTLFRRRIDVTSVLAVSIVSFPNIFCSGNLF